MYKQVELLQKSKANFISLKFAKQYLRVEHNQDDEMIQNMLEMAIIAAENYIGLVLEDSSFKMTIHDALPNKIKFINAPIIKIDSFKLYKTNNEFIELKEDSFTLDHFAEVIILKTSYVIKKAEIIYRAGYENIPAPIRQGILEHLAKLYDLRGGDNALPISAKSLYQAYKRVRL